MPPSGSVSVAPSASRRNGKAASCEPCRKRKIRCDHQQPICARCRHRGIENRCFYHPAPLTKHGNLQRSPPADGCSVLQDDGNGNMASFVSYPMLANSTNAISQALAGYTYQQNQSTDIDVNAYESRVQAVLVIVTQLRHVVLLKRLLCAYFATSAAELLPGALIIPAVLNLHDRWQQSDDVQDLSRAISEEIVLSTMTTIDASSLKSISAFCNAHHGKGLRLELLGFFFATAARACLYGLVGDSYNRDAFVQDMYQSSNEALRLARDMTPEVTDALVWLQHGNFLLTTALQGYTATSKASASWRRLSEMTSDMLALNMHREASYESIPFYLAECRKRIFAATYHQDKMVATLNDRQPRLLRRYSDCKMPLDITDDELLAPDPLELDNQTSLTEAGWCKEARFSNSSWARLRFNIAEFREEILEYSFQPQSSRHIENLRDMSKRISAQWNALPAHFRYSHDCWNSGLTDPVSFMLTSTYLTYRHLHFQILRIVSNVDADSKSSLLQTTIDIIATVIYVGGIRTRASFLAHDFELLILSYGIPSATVLTKALEHSSTEELPGDISRSKVIRDLSVFVSMLESLQGLTGKKESLCIESTEYISRVLDSVLDTPHYSRYAKDASAPVSHLNAESGSLGATIPSTPNGLEMLIPTIDAPLLDVGSLGLSPLPFDVDWASFGNDWMSI